MALQQHDARGWLLTGTLIVASALNRLCTKVAYQTTARGRKWTNPWSM